MLNVPGFAIFTLRKMALSGGLKGKEEAQEFASLCSIWLKFGRLEIEVFLKERIYHF